MLNNKDFFKINAFIAVMVFIILVSIPFATSSDTILSTKLMFLVPLVPAIILFFCIKKLYNNFRKADSGLNPGDVFQKTMQAALERFGVKTVASLNEKFIQKEHGLNLNYRYGNNQEYYTIALANIEKIKVKNQEHIDQTRYRIFYEGAVNNDYYKNNPFYLLKSEYVVITTDINAKIKVELPTMANLYWSEEELKHASPAEFVRASMSVPFFFKPFQKKINKDEDSVRYAWKYWMNTKKEGINPVGIFIDGGSISNFPIDLFHADEVFYPRMPLFGVQLTNDSDILSEKGKTNEEIMNTPFSYAGNIISTLKGFNDKTFLTKHTFYRLYSIQDVNCGTISWLNFFMKKEEKEELFNRGFQAALDFLNHFDWEKYKYERMMLTMKEKKILKEEDTPTVG